MASQSRFHRRRPTTWGPDSAAKSSLIVLAHVVSCPPIHFRQLGREGGRSTSRMSSPSARRAACPNHWRRCWCRTGGRGRRFRRRRRVVVGTRSIRRHRRMSKIPLDKNHFISILTNFLTNGIFIQLKYNRNYSRKIS